MISKTCSAKDLSWETSCPWMAGVCYQDAVPVHSQCVSNPRKDVPGMFVHDFCVKDGRDFAGRSLPRMQLGPMFGVDHKEHINPPVLKARIQGPDIDIIGQHI